MFVMKTGICQRPPLQWPQEVLAAGACFPYVLSLQPELLSVYSMLDQQRKQTVSLTGARGLLSTSGKSSDISFSSDPGQINRKEPAFVFKRRSHVCLSLLRYSQSFLRLLRVSKNQKQMSPQMVC